MKSTFQKTENYPKTKEFCATLFNAIRNKDINDSVEYKNKFPQIIQKKYGISDELMKKKMKKSEKDKRTKVEDMSGWAQTWITNYLNLVKKNYKYNKNGERTRYYSYSLTEDGINIKEQEEDLVLFFTNNIEVYNKNIDDLKKEIKKIDLKNLSDQELNDLNSAEYSYTTPGYSYTTPDYSYSYKKLSWVVKARIQFRDSLKSRVKCEIDNCIIKKPELLIASHIKPVNMIIKEIDSEKDNDKKNELIKEILDPDNGFWFCAIHDKIFDKFIISFDEKGKLLYNDNLKDLNEQINFIYKDIKKPVINIKKKNKKYLKFHKEMYDNTSKK